MGPLGPCHEFQDPVSPSHIPPSENLPELRYLNLRQRSSSVWVARATHNLGYAGAINAAIDRLRILSSWDGLWILNPDTRPAPRALAELVGRAKNGAKGMVGSTIVQAGAENIIRCRGGHRWVPLTGRAVTLGLNDRIGAPVDVSKVEADLDCISGASMFVTRACLEQIGPMDERFFLYYEDIDWGVRAKRLGLGYAVASVVAHSGGTTLGSPSVRRTDRTWLAIYLENRNRIHFTRKVYPLWLPLTYFVSVLHGLRYLWPDPGRIS